MPVAEGLLLLCEHDVAYAVLMMDVGWTVAEVRDFMVEADDDDAVMYGDAIVEVCLVCAYE